MNSAIGFPPHISGIDMNPKEKVEELCRIIADAQAELSKVGVEHDIDVTISSPDRQHSTTLATRSFLVETLYNYGWESSDHNGEQEKAEDLSDDDLLEAFYGHVGWEVEIGDWISSSAMC